jgi:hypothetical protein
LGLLGGPFPRSRSRSAAANLLLAAPAVLDALHWLRPRAPPGSVLACRAAIVLSGGATDRVELDPRGGRGPRGARAGSDRPGTERAGRQRLRLPPWRACRLRRRHVRAAVQRARPAPLARADAVRRQDRRDLLDARRAGAGGRRLHGQDRRLRRVHRARRRAVPVATHRGNRAHRDAGGGGPHARRHRVALDRGHLPRPPGARPAGARARRPGPRGDGPHDRLAHDPQRGRQAGLHRGAPPRTAQVKRDAIRGEAEAAAAVSRRLPRPRRS